MGNGRLNIGVGQGGATIWNSQPAIQAFGNIVAQQRAQRDAENKDLVDQMSKIRTDGLREGDRNGFNTRYNDWRDTTIQANNTPGNSDARIKLLGDAKRKLDDLHTFIGQSKQQGTDYNQKANMFLQDSFRHQYKDDAIKNFMSVKDLPMDDPRYVQYSDVNNLKRQPDNAKVDAAIVKAKDLALKGTQWSNDISIPGVARRGIETGANTYKQQVIPFDGENGVLHRLLNAASASPDFKVSLDDRYGDMPGATPEDKLANQVKQYATDQGWGDGWVNKTTPVFTRDYTAANKNLRANHAWIRQNDINNPLPIRNNANQLTPAQILTNNMRSGDPAVINHFIELAPKAQYGGEKPTFTIDKLTGNHIIQFPPQVVPNEKNIEANKVAKKRYDNRPKTISDVLGFGSTKVPFEKSAKYAQETTVKKPAAAYILNPNDPEGYMGQASQIAVDQNIKLPQLNQILGKRGGRGLIEPVATQGKGAPKIKVTIAPNERLY